MARIWILAILVLATGFTSAFAAMDPKEIEEIKEAAPLHLQGEVVEDALIKETDFPGQERIMTIQISEIHKGSQLFEPGNTIDVSYTYIPAWLEAEGGTRMDIAVSDRIEIWLSEEGGGWRPAASGDTVTHLSKSEDRPEHMPQPLLPATSGYLANAPLPVTVALILGIILGVVIFLSGKFSHSPN